MIGKLNLAPRRWFGAMAVTGALLTVAFTGTAKDGETAPPAADKATAEAIFAGGCFWCMEADFEKLAGVAEAISGYAGGSVNNPSYKQVSGGGTDHAEVVKVIYDPSVVSYEKLLEHFWKNVDPTTPDQQFCDKGSQYRAALMPESSADKEAARASLDAVKASGRFDTVHVRIEEPGRFWVAEDYHQDYYKKNPIRYRWYRGGCERDRRLAEVWGE